MDTNWRSPSDGEPAMDAGDWRTQLQPDLRHIVINRIMDTLKRVFPLNGQEGVTGGPQLKQIAISFEQKMYAAATSQRDYVKKITMKMLTLESKSQNTRVNSVPSNSAGNSSRPPDAGSFGMPSQPPNQGQAISMLGPANQSQTRQQLSSQNIQNNFPPAGVQNVAGLSSGLNQTPIPSMVGQSGNLQSMSGTSRNSLGNSMSQGLASNLLTNSQRTMPGRQQMVPQQLQQQPQNSEQYMHQQQLPQQQLMKPNFNPGNIQRMQNHMQQQQQQQNLLQPSQLQSSQQSAMQLPAVQSSLSSLQQNSSQSMLQQHPQSVLRQQQPQQSSVIHQQQAPIPPQLQQQQQQPQLMVQQPNSTNFPQNQLIGQQNNVGDMQQQQHQRLLNMQRQHQQQKQLMAQQNSLSNMHQQQLGPQSNVAGLQKQQHLGSPSGNSSMLQPKVQQHQRSSLPNQGHQSQPQASQQQFLSQIQPQPAPMQQRMSMQQQSNPLQREMQQRIQASGQVAGSILHPQNVTEQQKQLYLAQRTIPETSSNSPAQTGQTNGADWQEEVYQKVKAMKDTYYPELSEMYQKVAAKLHQHDSFPHQPKTEQLEKLKTYKTMLERLLTILQLSKSNISPSLKERLDLYEKQMVHFINNNRPRNPVNTLQPGELPPPRMQSMQQSQSQMTQAQLHENQMNSQLQPVTVQGSVPPMQQNNLTLPQNSMSSLSGLSTAQQNMTNSLHPSSNMLQNNVNPPQSNPGILHSQHIKQQEHQIKQQYQRQVQQQLMQVKQQMPGQLLQLNQMSDVNDSKSKPGMGVKPGTFQQHISAGQRGYPHQQSKSESPYPATSSNQFLQAQSPQLSQHSSPQVDQQLLGPKVGTPLQNASSPFLVPSPSTSTAPSPMPGESEKLPSLSNAASVGHQPTASIGVIGTPGISASPLLAEFIGPDVTHGNDLSTISGKLSVTEQPFERLIKAVKSTSPKALSASISDICSVVCMNDTIAGSAPGNGSRAAVGEDLVAMTKGQASNFTTNDGTTNGTRKMRGYTSAMPSKFLSSGGSIDDSLDAPDLESTATSPIKRPRIEANHALMEELRELNRRLIDTVVDISDEDVDPNTAAAERGEGTIVKCSFDAVALGPNLKSQYASAKMSPIQPLILLVPKNYPNCSPILLDNFPAEVSKEYEDLSVKAKSRFSVCLRSISEPMSLGEIATTWDICARAIISEHAQCSGGGTFSSKYGTWENCLTAA